MVFPKVVLFTLIIFKFMLVWGSGWKKSNSEESISVKVVGLVSNWQFQFNSFPRLIFSQGYSLYSFPHFIHFWWFEGVGVWIWVLDWVFFGLGFLVDGVWGLWYGAFWKNLIFTVCWLSLEFSVSLEERTTSQTKFIAVRSSVGRPQSPQTAALPEDVVNVHWKEQITVEICDDDAKKSETVVVLNNIFCTLYHYFLKLMFPKFAEQYL